MSDRTPSITLRGAWKGRPGEPERTFHGTVTDSAHPQVAAGHACRVTFEHSGQRVTGADDHGTYVLHLTGRQDETVRLVLTRFTSQASASTHLHDEALDDDWYAVPARP